MPNCGRFEEIVEGLRRYFGQTVTIYTTSGGDSGSGFTGVLISVNCNFVRLLSDIGPAPACALGSCCRRKHGKNRCDDESGSRNNNIDCRGRNVGAIVDIPIRSIAAFVHNTL